jgi:hypothetical protein
MIVENKPNVELHHAKGPTFHQHLLVLTFDLITCEVIKNILIKLETPTLLPPPIDYDPWSFQISKITSFKANGLENLIHANLILRFKLI